MDERMDVGKITRTLDVLTRASELLADAEALIVSPRCWTRRARARDEHGRIVGAGSEHARAWCALGAIDRVYERALYAAPHDVATYGRARRAALHALARAVWPTLVEPDLDECAIDVIMAYNDRARDKRAVIALFRRARKRLERAIVQQLARAS
jgi:hypothetical protein